MSKTNNALKFVIAAAALAAAGMASAASTAPVGEGEGAAANYLANAQSTLSRDQVQARAAASVAPVGEGDGAAAHYFSDARATLTRAEVQADLNLWNKAGLGELAEREDQGYSDPRYAQRLATYQRLRSGPDYVAEVRRLGGVSADYAAGNSATRVQ